MKRVKIKDAVVCSECGKILEQAKYTLVCSQCGVDMEDRSEAPMGAYYVFLRGMEDDFPEGHGRRKDMTDEVFHEPECIADYLKGLLHDSFTVRLPQMTRHEWRRFAKRFAGVE